MKTFRYAVLAAFALTLAAPAARAEKAAAGKPRVIEMSLTDAGLSPADVKLTKGQPVKIAFTRKTERTCMFDIAIPEAGVKKAVPVGKTVDLEFTPSKSGTLRITCGMGMQFGKLLVN